MTPRRSRHRRRRHHCLWWPVGVLLVVFASVSFQLFTSFHVIEKKNEKNENGVLVAPSSSSSRNKGWAYAFLMAGCDPQAPLTYRNYLYNILVASKLLREGGTKADIIVMVQFSKQSSSAAAAANNTNATTQFLPTTDLQWLELYNIKVHYLPPPIRDNFYNAQLSKFRILEFTHYSRVLYLDADVLPLCSLDYLLELSSSPNTATTATTTSSTILQPNIILAWFTEPAHGGLFVLEPGKYSEWQEILKRREQEALTLPYPHWDPVIGWGQRLTEEWRGIPNNDGTTTSHRHSLNWTFHGDFADQGFLYYWTRFHKSEVSIVFLDEIENWKDGKLVSTYQSKDLLGNHTCLPKGMEYPGHYGSTLDHRHFFHNQIPHRDFIHFSGDTKPWEQRRKEAPTSLRDVHSSTDYWYYQLQLIFEQFGKRYPNRKLPSFPLKYKQPSLGRYPTFRSMIGTIQKKQRKEQHARNGTV